MAHLLEELRDLVADKVMRQWHEGACPIVDYDIIFAAVDQFNYRVKISGPDLVSLNYIELLYRNGLIPVEGCVYWICINAKGYLALSEFVLCESCGNHRFADASFSLQDHMNFSHQIK